MSLVIRHSRMLPSSHDVVD